MSVRYAAIVLLALGAIAIDTRAAFADSINLLRPAAKGLSPSILIDAKRRPLDSDDQAAAQIDEDCIALSDRASNSAERFGSVRWNFGQLTWDWDESNEPKLIYILCVDPKHEAAPLGASGGGLGLMAGLSWSGASAATRANEGRDPATALVVNAERPVVVSGQPIVTSPSTNIGGVPAGNSGNPPAGSPGSPTIDGGGDLSPSTALNQAFPFSSGTSGFAGGSGFSGGFGSGGGAGGGNSDAPMAPFDPPITLDPEEMAPVPEPGTWLLMGTGLAAAWRAARRRK